MLQVVSVEVKEEGDEREKGSKASAEACGGEIKFNTF